LNAGLVISGMLDKWTCGIDIYRSIA